MDTKYAEVFGATNLGGILMTLGSCDYVCERLIESLGPIEGAQAVEMLRKGELVGDIGDNAHDFIVDEIENQAEHVWTGCLYDPNDEENPDGHCPISIREYCRVFFVDAVELDNAGYFLSREDAMNYIASNWEYVREDSE